MNCCFMNFHEQESTKDLIKHLDREIDIAIGKGCSVFMAGTRYPEDDIFAERVMDAAKYYAEGEISLVRMDSQDDAELRKCFVQLAHCEIYAY